MLRYILVNTGSFLEFNAALHFFFFLTGLLLGLGMMILLKYAYSNRICAFQLLGSPFKDSLENSGLKLHMHIWK